MSAIIRPTHYFTQSTGHYGLPQAAQELVQRRSVGAFIRIFRAACLGLLLVLIVCRVFLRPRSLIFDVSFS